MSTIPLIITAPYYIESDDCGYCHDKKLDDLYLGVPSLPDAAKAPLQSTHISIGCQVEGMDCQQYDTLINLGFRRSGNFLYKGDMLRGCCRMYTIRTDLSQMKIQKEHRQVVNRFKRFLEIPEQKAKKGEQFQLDSLRTAESQNSRFRTEFGPPNFTKEKFELFKKYQILVHNDKPEEITPKSFDRFLCLSPFPDSEIEGTDDEWDYLNLWHEVEHPNPDRKRIGPTHDCYYYDDKLIAISVLDFLPSGVSSIYFIWDPDFHHLSLGTLLGLREILLCSRLGLGYYYLGYYIDDCPKMRYKAKFGGELLDVCHDTFVPLSEVKPFLQDGRFFVLKDPDMPAGEEFKTYNTGNGKRWPHPIYKNASQTIYQNPAIYDTANGARKEIESYYSVDDFRLPNVLPGATPLMQVWEEKASFQSLFIHLFDSFSGRLINKKFSLLPPDKKARVLEFSRLFGREILGETVLIV